MGIIKLAGAICAAFLVASAQAQTPTAFSAGTGISSGAVNSSFGSKGDAINGTFTNPHIVGGSQTGPAISGAALTTPTITGGAINNTTISGGSASTTNVTATGGTTNPLATWAGYLAGQPNPNPVVLSGPPGPGPRFASTQNLVGTAIGQNFANNFYIASDTMNLGAGFSVGWNYSQLFGGPGTFGNRVGLSASVNLISPTDALNAGRNYVGLQGGVIGTTGDGGTNLTTGAKGALFGLTSYFRCYGQYYLECTGGEINSFQEAGSSTKYKNIFSLVGGGIEDVVQGFTYDTMLAFSDQPGSVGHQSAILIGPMNGQYPITSTGSIMLAIGGATVTGGIDFTNILFSGNAFSSPGFRVDSLGGITANGLTTNDIVQFGILHMKTYTVATLPTCNAGATSGFTSVTDATAPTYNGTLTGGGTVHIPVFCNGTAWTAH